MGNHCPLCNSQSELLLQFRGKDYFVCPNCKSVYLHPKHHLCEEDEMNRYLLHSNDISDPGYRDFVTPIVKHVEDNFSPAHKGLDFGCGTGPVISKMLEERGFEVELYDPYFFNNFSALTQQYDFIICCEVIEHFYNPYREFCQLRSMLKPSGELICMTNILHESINFETWHYKNDATHVFFYHPQSVSFIKNEFGFNAATINNRIIHFSL